MSMLDEEITQDIAAIVLGHRGEPGGHPISTTQRYLLDAAFAMDPDHQEALAKGFPGVVDAVRMFQRDRDGIAKLQELAEVDV